MGDALDRDHRLSLMREERQRGDVRTQLKVFDAAFGIYIEGMRTIPEFGAVSHCCNEGRPERLGVCNHDCDRVRVIELGQSK
jgi:hypothetical protein